LNSKKTWAEKFEIFRTTQKIHVGQMWVGRSGIHLWFSWMKAK
jgi:hypothetical protein